MRRIVHMAWVLYYSPLLSKKGILKLLMSVRLCVCVYQSSVLRDGWMDHFEKMVYIIFDF